MIGMILCGGHGKRLKPLTDEVPKSLIELKEGYSILDKQIFDFKNAGVDEVFLLTGYLSEKIEERYKDGYKRVKVSCIREKEPLGTLNAIRLGLEAVKKGDVIIRNGDIVADINLKKMIESSKDSKYPVTMFITKMPSPYGVVEIGEDSIKSFREKPILDYYINGGVYYLKYASFKLFREFETGDVEKTVFPQLARKNLLGFYKEEDLFWIAVDTAKDLEEIKREYENRKDKPWGYEKVIIDTEKYLTKELFIREGFQTSYHYHGHKDETMLITKGSGYIEIEGKKNYFKEEDTLRIKPKTKHTIVATEDTWIKEVSTPHLEDTIRVKDFYTR